MTSYAVELPYRSMRVIGYVDWSRTKPHRETRYELARFYELYSVNKLYLAVLRTGLHQRRLVKFHCVGPDAREMTMRATPVQNPLGWDMIAGPSYTYAIVTPTPGYESPREPKIQY